MIKRVNELSPERAKALLGNKEISEERLKKVVEKVKAFCKVAYQLYSKTKQTDNTGDDVRILNLEPPDEFTKAA
ncbi:MAG: hypothetical protein H0W84_09135 [Bacteroidetes bacterium]|nr:hypothetical protein [Bacteroidota bacterium]